MYPKKRFWAFVPSKIGLTFYLRYTIIHVTVSANTPRKVKDGKIAQVL